jgi:hypothetical protein
LPTRRTPGSIGSARSNPADRIRTESTISLSFSLSSACFFRSDLPKELVEICDLLDSAETRDQIHSDLNQAGEEQTDLKTSTAICSNLSNQMMNN